MGLANVEVQPLSATDQSLTAQQRLLDLSGPAYQLAVRVLRSTNGAEDAVQQAYVKAIRNLPGNLPPDELRAWFLRVVANTAKDHLKEEARRHRREAGMVREPQVPLDSELLTALRRGVDELEDKYRLPISLCYEQCLSHAEAAAVLELPKSTLTKHVSDGLELLRTVLAKGGWAAAPALITGGLANTAPIVPAGMAAAIQHALATAATSAVAGGTGAAVSAAAKAQPLVGKALAAKAQAAGVVTASKLKIAGVVIGLTVLAGAGAHVSMKLFGSGREDPQPLAAPVQGDPKEDESKPTPPVYPVTTINGTVTEAKTGKPIPGVTVAVHADDGTGILPEPGGKTCADFNKLWNWKWPAVETDAQGRYTLRFMTGNRCRFSAEVCTLSTRHQGTGYTSIPIYQGETVAAKALTVTPYLKARARVVDADGKPVAGATVRSFGYGESVTDKDGYFTDESIPENRISWDVQAHGFELLRFPFWSGDKDAGEPVIRLKPCKPITGVVLDADGKPAKNILVYGGQGPSTGFFPNWSVPVDDQGRFTLGTVLPGGGKTTVFIVRGYTNVAEPQQAAPGQAGLEFRLFPFGRIEVEIKDEQGKPLPNARVRGMQKDENGRELNQRVRWSTANEQGLAIIEDAPAGPTKLNLFERLNEAGDEILVEKGKTAKAALTYRPLPNQKEVVGFLVDGAGKPLLHAHVGACLRLGLQGPQSFQGECWTQVDGRYELLLNLDLGMNEQMRAFQIPAPEKAGQVRIVAELQGYQGRVIDSTRDWPKAGNREDAGKIAVTLAPERTLTIACARSDGKPMDVWMRACIDEAGKNVLFSRLDAMDKPGTLKLGVRGEGKLKIRLADPASNAEIEIVAPADAKAETPLQAVFPGLRRFEWTVLDEAGKPVEGARFTGYPDNRELMLPNPSSDKAGKIAFDASPAFAGQFLVFADAAHAPHLGKIATGADPFRETIRLKPADATLSGRAVDEDGKGIPGARIDVLLWITPNIATSFNVTADKDGAYSTPVASGYEVSLQAVRAEIMAVGQSPKLRVSPGQKAKLDVTVIDRTKPRKPAPPKPPPPPAEDF
ncbi:MAG: hypothetical protein HY291_02785 [Planctomycetes bacterium]|nr:hypothetical protein [Planctomycetota bacterium]